MGEAENNRNDAIQHTSTHLAKIIRRRYDATDEHGNPLRGIFLIDTPCGSGKTSCVPIMAASVAKDLRDPEKEVTKRRIIFLTPQKKNLGKLEDYVKAYREAGIEEGPGPHEILFVPALIEMIDANLTPELMRSMPRKIFTSDEFSALKTSVEYLRAFRQRSASMYAEDAKALEEKAEEQVRRDERAFRAYVGKKLATRVVPSDEGEEPKEELLDKAARMERLRNDPEWKWLGELYPTAFVGDALVIAMTVSKFNANIHTIVDRPYCFRDSALVDDAVIIMDESDSCKATMLKNEVELAVDTPVDIIDLARQIARGSDYKKYPRGITRNSKWRREHDYKDVREFWERIKDVSCRAMKEVRLQYQFKSAEDVTRGQFLFYDYKLHVLGGGRCVVKWDGKENHNSILMRRKDDAQALEEGKAKTLSEVVGRAQGVASFLQSYLWVLSQNYFKNIAKPDADTMNCARSILHVMHLSDRQIEYMINGARNILRRGTRSAKPKNTAAMVGDRSVYARGFKFLSLKDDERHSASTEVMSYALQTTPERMMLDFGVRALVVCMSATVSIDSALCNHDFSYIERQQPGMIMRLTDEESKELADAWNAMQSGYSNVETVFGRISAAGSLKGWTEVMGGDAEAGMAAFGRLRDVDKSFIQERYARFVKAFRYFVENDGIHAMLALAMPAPKPGSDFDRWVIRDLCDILCRSLGKPERIDDLRFITSSDEFDREYVREIRPDLESGKRAFIVASYQTMGTGVNPQYVPPDDMETIVVNPFAGKEVDFDAIFLDNITNLAPHLHRMQHRELLTSMYELSELYERLQIDSKTYYRYLDVFARCVYSEPKFPVSLKGCVDAMRRGTFIVYQSLGRTDRTGRKAPLMHVLVSEECASSIDAHALDGKIVNRIYAEFVDYLAQPPIVRDEDKISKLDMKKRSEEFLSFIKTIVYTHAWSEEDTLFWKDLREQLMAHPTCDDESVTTLLTNVCFRQPRPAESYTFTEHQDFTVVEVSFDPSVVLKREVSAKAARLDVLSNIPEVAGLFENNGWPMEWKPGHWIMSPVLFQNVYLATIGEAVGRHLISLYYPEIQLSNLVKLEGFELSDFQVEGMDAFIDFKNWTVGSADDDVTEIAKVRKKANSLSPGCKAAVVNLMGSASDGYTCRHYDDGKTLTVPYLIDTDTLTIDQGNLATLVNWLKEGSR